MLIDPACKALREELKLYGLDARNADNNGHEIASRVTMLQHTLVASDNPPSPEKYISTISPSSFGS